MIRSWEEGWLDLPQVVGDRLGEACLGAGKGQIVVGDSTTIWLYKALRVAAGMRAGRSGVGPGAVDLSTGRVGGGGGGAGLGGTVGGGATGLAGGGEGGPGGGGGGG